MAKRKWTNMQVLESQILAMREAGLSRRMIADELGLELRQIENWINRKNRARAKLSLGIVPKRKGRPRKRSLSTAEEYEKEIAILQMENKLLRDFLQLTERM
jgi:transposase